jgi:3-dehydroquinate synthase
MTADTSATTVDVAAASPYSVVVGTSAPQAVAELVADALRVAVIHPDTLGRQARSLCELLRANGHEAHAIEVPTGEAAKDVAVAGFCWSVLGQAGFTRSDVVVGLGGGATTDLAGFVAASWLRGVRLVQVPTTLLGMVDAAVGGKTGINTPEGKNLVGAFHEPVGVVCDLDTLATLPRAELVSGLAEVVKCGFVADPHILDLVDASPEAALDPRSDVLRELVVAAISVKARVVSADLTETGAGGGVGREVLNYGHTFGHAVERVERYQFRHGAAVAVGMTFVAELARLAGTMDESLLDRHRDLLSRVDLPTTYVPGRWDELHAAMRVDKKTRGDRLRFVVLEDLARPTILEGPEESLLTAAYARIAR